MRRAAAWFSECSYNGVEMIGMQDNFLLSGISSSDAWEYRWEVVLVRDSIENPGFVQELKTIVSTPESLCELIIRHLYDPNSGEIHVSRKAELDLSCAPAACQQCGEPYVGWGEKTSWRECQCGGHHIHSCQVCGERQFFPKISHGCTMGHRGVPVRRHRVSAVSVTT
jgi:hypothetical protein